MSFKPIQKLSVTRTLTTGESVAVGVLAQNRKGVFFQYDDQYLEKFGNLSPFGLNANNLVQAAPKTPHNGLHGVFGDCLPDGWGTLLQDRIFRQEGVLPAQITAMDRLAFVANKGMGALAFAPASELLTENEAQLDLGALGREAQTLFDQSVSDFKDAPPVMTADVSEPSMQGDTEQVLAALVAGGSSGGARPKAQIYMPTGETKLCRTLAQPGDEGWLVKFTSQNLLLGHEEGLCEAVYLQMAKLANCQPADWQLIEAPKSTGAIAWLALRRFDYISSNTQNSGRSLAGKVHMHSACGLLDADYRLPSLDYVDLIKASRHLCKSPAAGQLQFRRAMFNLLSSNQDDHSKNWAFLQSDDGQWQPSPFYDVTYSPHPFNEHATAFGGYGKAPTLKAVQALAASAGFSHWRDAQQVIHEVDEALSQFSVLAKQLGVSNRSVDEINKTLAQRRKENTHLF